MTTPLRRFPDVQVILVNLLEEFVGLDRTGIETPVNLQARLPFIRVVRTGGSSGLLVDHATVDVDCFGTGYTATELLAEQVRQYLTGPPLRYGPQILDRITCESSPTELPWAPGMRRIGATYLVTARRYTTAI